MWQFLWTSFPLLNVYLLMGNMGVSDRRLKYEEKKFEAFWDFLYFFNLAITYFLPWNNLYQFFSMLWTGWYPYSFLKVSNKRKFPLSLIRSFINNIFWNNDLIKITYTFFRYVFITISYSAIVGDVDFLIELSSGAA